MYAPKVNLRNSFNLPLKCSFLYYFVLNCDQICSAFIRSQATEDLSAVWSSTQCDIFPADRPDSGHLGKFKGGERGAGDSDSTGAVLTRVLQVSC